LWRGSVDFNVRWEGTRGQCQRLTYAASWASDAARGKREDGCARRMTFERIQLIMFNHQCAAGGQNANVGNRGRMVSNGGSDRQGPRLSRQARLAPVHSTNLGGYKTGPQRLSCVGIASTGDETFQIKHRQTRTSRASNGRDESRLLRRPIRRNRLLCRLIISCRFNSSFAIQSSR